MVGAVVAVAVHYPAAGRGHEAHRRDLQAVVHGRGVAAARRGAQAGRPLHHVRVGAVAGAAALAPVAVDGRLQLGRRRQPQPVAFV